VSAEPLSLHRALAEQHRVRALASGRAGVGGPFPEPVRVEIQPTARCHRTCAFCSHLTRNAAGGDLPEPLVLALLGELADMGVRKVAISGGGEPLIWEGSLAAVLQAAARFGSPTLTTSGDQLWDDGSGTLSDLARSVLPACDALLLNVPGVDDASLRLQLVGGPTWARTRQLLAALVAFSGHVHRPEIYVVVVVNSRNLHDLPAIDRTLTGLGISHIYYKRIKLYEPPGGRAKLRVEPEGFHGLAAALGDGAASAGLRRFVANVEPPRDAPVPCRMVELGFDAVIDPRGDVFVCTPTVGEAEHAIGNVYASRFAEIWGGPRHQEVVSALTRRSAAGSCPGECRYHPHNRAIRDLLSGSEGGGPPLLSNAGLDDAL